MDLEDRYKFIFAGFGIIRWIRLDMATYLNGSGKIWMALSGFDWIWGPFVGFCWIWNNSLDSFGHGNIFGWVWEDLDGFERL